MRILLLTQAFNSLTQRLFVEIRELEHEVSVEFDINNTVTSEAIKLFQPDLIIAPFLKRAIPASIWRRHVCLVVHPGIPGDRGPSALDWAVLEGKRRWGVTVLQANGEMDAGDIWAWSGFDMRTASKASLYRSEVTEAAVKAVTLAVQRFQTGDFKPLSANAGHPEIQGRPRPSMRQRQRAIDWQADETTLVLRKIRSADGFPGLRDEMLGRELYLYDAHAENSIGGTAGELVARCGAAVCRATTDGAIWIGHVRDKHSEHPFKLPATNLLASEIEDLPEIEAGPDSGYRDIHYRQHGKVGYLYFSFYNGAMGTDQCKRLRRAYRDACQHDTRVIVLMGGPDFWSNGMHLNLIEASASSADESWRNINAIDDLAAEIIQSTSHITIAALRGNAGAGGVFLARAADYVWAHKGVVLNPHYKDMGNLFGSEYWTYLLPRFAGKSHSKYIIESRLPMSGREARRHGLLDDTFGTGRTDFENQVATRADRLANAADFYHLLEKKRSRRSYDEDEKPLEAYRQEELENMKLNFYGFDPSYHVARYNFVYKTAKSRTPLTIASHRRKHGKLAALRSVS